MRRPRRHRTGLVAGLLICALVLTAPGVAQAGHEGIPHADGELSALIAAVAEANQRVADIGADIQSRQEGVNKALVDVVNARDAAQAARRDVEASRTVRWLTPTLRSASRRIGSTSSPPPPTSTVRQVRICLRADRTDIIATASADQTLGAEFSASRWPTCNGPNRTGQQGIGGPAAQQRAEQAAADAQASQDAAVAALTSMRRNDSPPSRLSVDRLVAERDAAQARLDAARPAHAAVTAAAAPDPSPASRS